MPTLFQLPTFSDERGHLTVIEEVLPLPAESVRRMRVLPDRASFLCEEKPQAIICLQGNCQVETEQGAFNLQSPEQLLLLEASKPYTLLARNAPCLLLLFS